MAQIRQASVHILQCLRRLAEHQARLLNCHAPQTQAIELAMAIRDIDPSQGIIIAAFDYRSAGEVPRPPEVMHIPLLIDIGRCQLRSLLEKIEVDRAIKTLAVDVFVNDVFQPLTYGVVGMDAIGMIPSRMLHASGRCTWAKLYWAHLA